MNENTTPLLSLKPLLPNHWLLIVSGLIWTVVGSVLVSRSLGWLPTTTPELGSALEASSALIALAGYNFGFYKIVEKNTSRILSLPAKASLFAFTPLRGYLMIGGMVTLGILLRNSPIPKVYLILPYSSMGLVLFLGSLGFYRRFFQKLHVSG